jgi:hypothetical protein
MDYPFIFIISKEEKKDEWQQFPMKRLKCRVYIKGPLT